MGLLKDLLFPKFCLNCGRLGNYLCLLCQKKLLLIDIDCCFYCGRNSYLGLTHAICKRQNGVDGMLCVFRYNPVLKKIIKNIKYRLVKEALRELLNTIPVNFFEKVGNYKSFNKEITIQPIPLHPNRLKLRGFNQAVLLGEYISNVVLIPVVDILKKIKDTHPQATLIARKSRYINLLGAFSYTNQENFGDLKNIILVDDVVTTGATCREATRILKRSGASNIYIVALAKG